MKIDKNATVMRGAVISGNVTLEEGVSVWYNSVLRGDLAEIKVGKNSNIQENTVVHLDNDLPCIIGEGVTVGHSAILHGCTVGDNTIIGMGAILLSGAKVGKNCIIGAGALLTGKADIPDGHLAVGSPAKVVRPLTEAEIEGCRANAEEYLHLTENEKSAEVFFGE